MAKFDLSKYKIQNSQENEIPIVKKFDLSKYEISAPKEDERKTQGDERKVVDNDEYPYLVNKLADGISRYPIDLAHDLAYAGERGAKWLAGKLADDLEEEPKPINLFGYEFVPTRNDWSRKFREFSQKPDYFSEENIGRPSNRITRPIFKEAGFNLDAEAPDQIQGMIGHGIDFAIPGAFTKKARLANMAIEGATGLGSGGLQEYGGVNPIVADIASYMGRRGVSRTNSALRDHFNPIKRGEKKVSALFKDATKEEGLDNLMNFNPEGLDVIPVTAEIALHNGISNLHNAYAPTLTGIKSKMTANDEILRKKIDEIGNSLEPKAIEVGEAGRELINQNYHNLKELRKKKATPYYEALKQENYYPVENFKNSIKEDLSNTVGDTKKTLKKFSNSLKENNKEVLESLKKELSLLQKENKINLDLNLLPQKVREELLLQDPALYRIEELKNQISLLESDKYRPVIIDEQIKEINKKIKNNTKTGKDGQNALLKKQVKALEADLAATPEGLAHREVYREHSLPIDQIKEDSLLSKFVKKKDSDFKEPVDELADYIFSAPQESVKRYMAQVKGSNAENLTKAYGRKEYLGKGDNFEGGLPTYDKSSKFLKNKAAQMEAIYSPEELEVFKQINEYLKNRVIVGSGNSAFGSATEPRGRITQRVKKYLGEENLTPYTAWGDLPGIRKLPFIPQRLKGIAKPNQNYEIFERALTDPMYARDLLTKDYGVKYTKPNYFPTLYNVLNGNKE